MRVAVLTPYTEPHLGGITSYARELAVGYRDLGLEVRGLAAEGYTNPIFSVPERNKLMFSLRATLALLDWRPDIVHAHSHWHLLVPGVVLRAFNRKTRLIFTFHTPWGTSRRGLRFALLELLLRFATLVSFVSREMRDTLHLPASIPQSVVYAAPEHSVTKRLRQAESESGHPTVLSICPMVWPDKVAGLLKLLEAFASVARSYPEWRLSIVGDGPLRTDIEERAESLGLRGAAILKGWVEDVSLEMARAEIYAQITQQEGLPLSLLNAMAMGLPTVATAVGGIPEVVVDAVHGFLVPPDPALISSALSRLMSDKHLRTQMGAAARRSTSQRTWKEVAGEYVRAAGVEVS